MSATAQERRGLALACPECVSILAGSGEGLSCPGCGRSFAIVAGIPDLRLSYPDPYMSWEEDVALARALDERFDALDFAGLLREHWAKSGKPDELVERFVSGSLGAIERSEAYLRAIERHRGRPLAGSDRFLEIGCGDAGLSQVAAATAGTVVASDLSLRWLVLAKKRLAEAGIDNVQLVCCSAEDPAFGPECFDVLAASDVIEHVSDQQAFAQSCRGLLRAWGTLFLATPNRFSLSLEPHVRLWGVGYLPRWLAKRYVRAVRKAPYEHVRLLSASGLRRLLRRHGFESVEIVPPEIPASSQRLYSGAELQLVRAYNRLRRRTPARLTLLAVGPFFHVFAGRRG